MSGQPGTGITGLSGNIFKVGSGGVSMDAFEKQPKGSVYQAEYKAMQQSLPVAYRNNDTLVDKAIEQYFTSGIKPGSGIVQKTQARQAAAQNVVSEHKQELAKAESAVTAKLNAQQLASHAPAAPNVSAETAKLANLPGASALSNPTARGVVQTIVNAEIRVMERIDPAMAVAAKAGLSSGMALAYVAADSTNPLKPNDVANTKPDPAQDPESQPKLTGAPMPDADNKDDKSCAVIGEWVAEKPGSNSKNVIAYQGYVTGKEGYDFHVKTVVEGNVKFDGCKDEITGPVLLEAKADHGGLLSQQEAWSYAQKIGIPEQGPRQDSAAKEIGVRNEWHTQTENDRTVIEDIFREKAISTPVIHTPMPKVPER